MASSVNMFNIGKSGLTVSKQSMGTTSHNIANVNTDGYSRQQVDQTAGPIIESGRLTIGTGAWSKQVSRVNDDYLNNRINKEAKNFGSTEEKDLYLQQGEQIFNEANSDGLNRLATRVFGEFRKLSADPSNSAVRASVRETSAQLAKEVNRMDRELKEVARNIDSRIEGYVRDVNSMAREVRDLNLSIQRTELGGGLAPDLYDKRDLALKKLGEMADISVNKDNNGRVSVTMANHVPIVNGELVTELKVLRTPPDPATGKKEERVDIVVEEPVPTTITRQVNTGRLGGLLEVRDHDIAKAQDKINLIAYTIAKEVNNIHRQGFGMDGAAGRDFFYEPMRKDDAAEKMRLSESVVDNLDAIATAKEVNSPSDNRIALAISAVGDMKGLGAEPNSSILDEYNSMVSDLAVKTGENKKSLVFQKDVLTQLEKVRDTLVGVSLDEETSNLVRFQHAYAANAKVLQVADELMQTVLNAFKG